MPDEAAARPNLLRALRETAVTALLAFGLFLPLIGFNTVQNIRNELVLETRWPLLLAIVAIIAGVRFLYLVVVAPLMAERARASSRPALLPTTLPTWAMPAVIGFVLVYPLLAMLIAGPGASKWIDNFGIQILIYVLLGWGLNIVVGLAGLLDLGYVAFYAIG